MLFSDAPCIYRDFPELATRVLRLEGLTPAAPVEEAVAGFVALARQRIATSTESDLPEIQAWRRAHRVEGMHDTAEADVARLIATLRTTISALWPAATIAEVQLP